MESWKKYTVFSACTLDIGGICKRGYGLVARKTLDDIGYVSIWASSKGLRYRLVWDKTDDKGRVICNPDGPPAENHRMVHEEYERATHLLYRWTKCREEP